MVGPSSGFLTHPHFSPWASIGVSSNSSLLGAPRNSPKCLSTGPSYENKTTQRFIWSRIRNSDGSPARQPWTDDASRGDTYASFQTTRWPPYLKETQSTHHSRWIPRSANLPRPGQGAQQLVYAFRQWPVLAPLGRTGSDQGVDIRGVKTTGARRREEDAATMQDRWWLRGRDSNSQPSA